MDMADMDFFIDWTDIVLGIISALVTMIGLILDGVAISKKAKQINESPNDDPDTNIKDKKKLKVYKLIRIILIFVFVLIVILCIVFGIVLGNNSINKKIEPEDYSKESTSRIIDDVSNTEGTLEENVNHSDNDSNRTHMDLNNSENSGPQDNRGNDSNNSTTRASSTTKVQSTTSTSPDAVIEYQEHNELVNNGIVKTARGVYYQFSEDSMLFEPISAQKINVVVHPVYLTLEDKNGNILKNAELKIATRISYYNTNKGYISLSENYNGELIGLQSGYYSFWVIINGKSYYSNEIQIGPDLPLDCTYTIILS